MSNPEIIYFTEKGIDLTRVIPHYNEMERANKNGVGWYDMMRHGMFSGAINKYKIVYTTTAELAAAAPIVPVVPIVPIIPVVPIDAPIDAALDMAVKQCIEMLESNPYTPKTVDRVAECLATYAETLPPIQISDVRIIPTMDDTNVDSASSNSDSQSEPLLSENILDSAVTQCLAMLALHPHTSRTFDGLVESLVTYTLTIPQHIHTQFAEIIIPKVIEADLLYVPPPAAAVSREDYEDEDHEYENQGGLAFRATQLYQTIRHNIHIFPVCVVAAAVIVGVYCSYNVHLSKKP